MSTDSTRTQRTHTRTLATASGMTSTHAHTGHHHLPTIAQPLSLNNVLVSPHLIKNLISVRTLARENPVNVEFDDYGFSIKDRSTKAVILRSDSPDELYPLHPSHPSQAPQAFTAVIRDTWHRRLGHLGDDALERLIKSK